MSINLRDMDEGVQRDPGQLIARAAAADTRAGRRLAAAIDDFFLPDDGRLDDRMRTSIALSLSGLVTAVEIALQSHAARLLATRGANDLAERLTQRETSVLDRLVTAGLLRDNDLMRELIARVRQDAIGDALPPSAPAKVDEPSLLTRLANHADTVVASAANALFVAESRRRGLFEGVAQTDLPAELHHRLVWWVAAALRERLTAEGDVASLDKALAEAAMRSLAAHDEGDRLEAVAMRLAAAYEAGPRELPEFLIEALGDRRIALFTALLAHAVGLSYEQAREVVADPYAAQLWLLLRAVDAGRTQIARIGLALCEADARRDIEAFADSLDAIVAVSPDVARGALAPMKLHPDFRAAVSALNRDRRR